MRRSPPPWLFAIASLPYGVFNGLIALALPYLMRRHGVSVERIASIVAIVQAPAIWYFLWAPLVDLRFRRRTWVLLLSVASGVCIAVALDLGFTGSLGAVTLVLLIGSVINQPISSALGGLVAAVTPRALRGRTSGWGQAGSLGGGVLAAGLAASSTRFTLFIAATNAPLVYMIWLDGIAHAHFGLRGMLAADAVANGAFGLILLASVGKAGDAPMRRPHPRR